MNEKIPVAAVATGFPSGQYHLETRLQEIRLTVADGASEIDIVINRTAALQGKWKCKIKNDLFNNKNLAKFINSLSII